MELHKLLPFTFDFEEQTEDFFLPYITDYTFYDVEFIQDFGCIKKGEKFDKIEISFTDGIYSIKMYDEPNINIVKTQRIVFTAI
jgi:hypothetical protein